MTILVFSDTHGSADEMLDIINKVRHDMVLHLGDCVSDIYTVRQFLPDENIYFVSGNNLFDILSQERSRNIFTAEKIVIFMTHGHEYLVGSGLSKLYDSAVACGAELVVYGHTHVPHIERRGSLTFLNPGSLTRARGMFGNSYAVVDINDGEVECRIEYI